MYDRVLLFGGTGSLGNAIVKQWKDKVNSFAVYSRDEKKHWDLLKHNKDVNITSYLGDVANYERVKTVLRKYQPTLVIIMSAMKHVLTCERSPELCLSTNVTGVLNILNAIDELTIDPLQKVIFVSTDKACAPVNIYGMSKSIGERLCVSKAEHFKVPINIVRYGNVLGSSGSIIPLLKSHCEQNNVLTLTDERMTRFCVSLHDAVILIEDAIEHCESGQILVPILPSMRLKDLFTLFSQKYKLPVEIIGNVPGEKFDELLISDYESVYTTTMKCTDKDRFVIHPSWNFIPSPDYSMWKYSSGDDCLCTEELSTLLSEYL